MVFCTYCGQAFAEDGHLERHILTRMPKTAFPFISRLDAKRSLADTQVKPFRCFACHMSFATGFVVLRVLFRMIYH
jgi:hypothetical protein